MGVIFTSEHTSDKERDYKIEIIDTDSGTLIDEMIVNQDGFRIEDTGNSKTLHDTIIGKVVSFTVQVRNQDQEDFIVSLAEAKEGRHIIKLYRDTNVIFIGVLVVDNVKIDNAPKPYDFELEAVDGVKLLKGVGYTPTFITRGGGTSGQQTMIQYLSDCFRKLPTIGQYSISDNFVSVATNWWSKEHIDNGQDSGDMLDKTYTFWQTWGEEQEENSFKYFDCYTIIEAILEAFNCRMYYDEGYYHIEQIGLRDSASVDEIIYHAPDLPSEFDRMDQIGTSSTDYDVDVDQTNNFHMAGGTIKLLPPLRRVLVSFDINPNYDLLPTSEPLDDERTPGYEAIGYFHITNETTTLTCILSLVSRFAGSAATTTDYRKVGYKLKIRVGSKVLDGYIGNMQWLDYATNTDAFVRLGFNDDPYLPIDTDQVGEGFDTLVNFTTPEITESGIVRFDLIPAYSYYDGTDWVYEENTPTDVIHKWYTTGEDLFPTIESNTTEEITVTSESSQDKGTSSYKRSIKISDGYVVGRPGVLTIKTNDATNEFAVTSGWKIGSGVGDYQIHSILLAHTILSQRLKTLRIYHGTIYLKTDYISIRNRVAYDGYNLIFNHGTLTTNFDELKIEGIEVSIDETGITDTELESQPEVPIGDNPVIGDPIGGDPDDPPTEGQTGLITDEVLYEGDVITQFDVIEAEQDYFVTGDKIIVKDRLDGHEQEFVLTAPILDGDTVVNIESATIIENIVIYSPVMFSPNESNRREDYTLLQNTTGGPVSELEVTTFTLPNPATHTNFEISKKLKVYRQSGKLIYSVGYGIDFANNKLTFDWDLQDQEYVEVFQK